MTISNGVTWLSLNKRLKKTKSNCGRQDELARTMQAKLTLQSLLLSCPFLPFLTCSLQPISPSHPPPSLTPLSFISNRLLICALSTHQLCMLQYTAEASYWGLNYIN